MNLASKLEKIPNITETERTFGALLRRPYQILATRVYARLAESGFDDIRPAHGAVFRHIGQNGSRITELAERAQITKQSMGALVEYLRDHGYVELREDPEDGRARIVCLTARGLAAQQKALEIGRSVERELCARIGEETMARLRAQLEQLYAALLEQAEENQEASDRSSMRIRRLRNRVD
jgi:DNA-binding MarR family transcriptional regulator